jgi:hypothetical protein
MSYVNFIQYIDIIDETLIYIYVIKTLIRTLPLTDTLLFAYYLNHCIPLRIIVKMEYNPFLRTLPFYDKRILNKSNI